MRLDITPGKGRVVAVTMTVDGKQTTLVNDPANTHRAAVPLAEWIEGTGGTMPILTTEVKPDADADGVAEPPVL